MHKFTELTLKVDPHKSLMWLFGGQDFEIETTPKFRQAIFGYFHKNTKDATIFLRDSPMIRFYGRSDKKWYIEWYDGINGEPELEED